MLRFDCESVARMLIAGICTGGAFVLIWRGNTFYDIGHEYNMTPPVMCTLMALALILTGLAVALRDREVGEE